MMTFMFPAPAGMKRGPVCMVIVLDRENLERMESGDPADIQLISQMQPGMSPRQFRNFAMSELDITICYEENAQQVIPELMNTGGIPAVLAYLERARQIKTGDLEPVKKLSE